MLGLRPTIVLGLVLAFIINIPTASSGGKVKPSCDKCTNSYEVCVKACKPGNTWGCEHDCTCDIGKNSYCRGSCGMGGPEAACDVSVK